jgi:hypothetical protein
MLVAATGLLGAAKLARRAAAESISVPGPAAAAPRAALWAVLPTVSMAGALREPREGASAAARHPALAMVKLKQPGAGRSGASVREALLFRDEALAADESRPKFPPEMAVSGLKVLVQDADL